MKLAIKTLMILMASIVLSGCWESDTENAVEDMGEAVEKTADDMGDAAEDAGEEMKDAAEEAAPE